MVLLDRFFDGTFFTYGIEVMSFADRDQEDRIDPVRNTRVHFVMFTQNLVTTFNDGRKNNIFFI